MFTTKTDGAIVRRLRLELGLEGPELAARVGISNQFLNKIENGLQDGSPKTRLALARELGHPLTDITYEIPTRQRRAQAA